MNKPDSNQNEISNSPAEPGVRNRRLSLYCVIANLVISFVMGSFFLGLDPYVEDYGIVIGLFAILTGVGAFLVCLVLTCIFGAVGFIFGFAGLTSSRSKNEIGFSLSMMLLNLIPFAFLFYVSF